MLRPSSFIEIRVSDMYMTVPQLYQSWEENRSLINKYWSPVAELQTFVLAEDSSSSHKGSEYGKISTHILIQELPINTPQEPGRQLLRRSPKVMLFQPMS